MSAIVRFLGPVWTIRLINTYYFCYNVFNTVKNVSGKVSKSVYQYLDGTSNRWVFLKDGAGPIPASMVPNYFTSRIVSWVYDTVSNTLHSTNPRYIPEFGDPVEQTIPVLSSSIRIDGTSYDMDNFMNSFSFISPLGIVPSPRLLMYCWSVYTAKWSIPENNPIFEFIDMDGNDMRHSVFRRRSVDKEQWDILFDIESNDSDENTTETEDDAEADLSEDVAEDDAEAEVDLSEDATDVHADLSEADVDVSADLSDADVDVSADVHADLSEADIDVSADLSEVDAEDGADLSEADAEDDTDAEYGDDEDEDTDTDDESGIPSMQG
jgi:hypothetical protein